MTAVFWDLDDTLINTYGARARALQEAYEQCCGLKADGRALCQQLGGGGVEELAQRLLGENYRRFVEIYRSRYYGQPRPIAPYEGVTPVLETLMASNIPMIVITSKVSWGAIEELDRCGLLPYFHSVVGVDDTALHTPEPDPVIEALDRLMIIEPENAFVVGDSAEDMSAAQEAGCRSIAALWGATAAAEVLNAGPEFEAEQPLDVLQIIREVVAS